MANAKTTECFLKEAKEVHGERYDYTLVNYKHYKTKIKVICKVHGVFEQTPQGHLFGKNCMLCAFAERELKTLDYRKYDAINKANKKHNFKYDYSLVDFKDTEVNVKIICPTHGIFEQALRTHITTNGCRKCTIENNNRIKIKNKEQDFSHIIPPEGAKIIPLTRGKYALVDEEDYERVMEHNWRLKTPPYTEYASTIIDSKYIEMHRFIMGVTDPKVFVDHIFHNGLDNRKSQLRICSQQQNGMNRRPNKNSNSIYKGVRKTNYGNYMAKIRFNGKSICLGTFKTEEEAAQVYDTKAKELFGEFAYLNFPNV